MLAEPATLGKKKRFSPVWNAKEQLAIALPFYEHLEKKFSQTFDQKFVIKKAFKSVEDQNNWFSAFDKPTVAPFLDAKLDKKTYKGVVGEHYFGNVKEGGRIDTHKLVEAYRYYLKTNQKIRFEKFYHNEICYEDHFVSYKNILFGAFSGLGTGTSSQASSSGVSGSST